MGPISRRFVTNREASSLEARGGFLGCLKGFSFMLFEVKVAIAKMKANKPEDLGNWCCPFKDYVGGTGVRFWT